MSVVLHVAVDRAPEAALVARVQVQVDAVRAPHVRHHTRPVRRRERRAVTALERLGARVTLLVHAAVLFAREAQ